MTKVIGNWVKENVSGTPGTDLTVTLIAISGFARVQDIPELTVGTTVKYAFEDGSNREFGLGTRQAGSTFDRTTPQATFDSGTYDNTAPSRISLTSSANLYLSSGAEDWTEAEQLAFISGATYKTIQDSHNVINSAGLVGTHTITDDADGTITVSAGTGFIRATDSDIVELVTTDWAAESGANVNLVDNDLNYVYVEYNSGSPQVIATTTKRTDRNTNIYLGSVYRAGTTLHITTTTAVQVGAHTSKMDNRLFDLDPFARASGAVISETGNRNLAITAGSFWSGLDNFTTASKDTNVADTFTAYYSDGASGFTAITAQTVLNNTQYDDGSGTLATLANNRYGVCWIYLSVEGDLYVVFGTASYTLIDAEAAPIPSSIPAHFEEHSRIVGKVIVLKSATNLQAVESAFTETFTTGLPTDHGDLIGLADDDHTQYLLVDGTRAATKFEFTGEIFRTSATLNGTAITNHVNLGASGVTGTAGQAYDYCTIGGGSLGQALEAYTTVCGGLNGQAKNQFSFTGGGQNALCRGDWAVAVGGRITTADGDKSTGIGGESTDATGLYATTLGGKGGTAAHTGSIAGCGAPLTRANWDVVFGATDSGVGAVANNKIRMIVSTGEVKADGAYSSPEADIATMVEWADGNPNNENRDGYLVSIVKGKLVIGGNNIKGVISSTPTIIGNNAPNKWQGTFLRDKFKKIEKEKYTLVYWHDKWGEKTWGYRDKNNVMFKEYPQPTSLQGLFHDEAPIGNITVIEEVDIDVINPAFDIVQSDSYKSRNERKEWGVMGALGQIVCHTLEPITSDFVDYDPITGRVKNGTKYDVMEIISDDLVKIFFWVS